MVSVYSWCWGDGKTAGEVGRALFIFSCSLLLAIHSPPLCPQHTLILFCFLGGRNGTNEAQPHSFFSFFSFFSLIQDKKSFHQKNRCHLLWSFVVVVFYYIKKILLQMRLI